MPFIGFAQGDSFDYVKWTNKEGRGFEARLDHVAGEKVVLRAKAGGKYYPVKTETLSVESKARIEEYKKDVRAQIAKIEVPPYGIPAIDAELVYRAVALGIEADTLLTKKTVASFTVSKIRVEDRLKAILEFEEGCFQEIQATGGIEFFVKEKTLHARSATKGRGAPYYYWNRAAGNVDKHTRVMLQEGGRFKVYLGPGTMVKWTRVGVTEGPVFQ